MTLNPQSRRRLIWAGAVVALLALGYWLLRAGSNAREAYETATLSRGEIRQTVSTSGTISPLITVQVGSQVSGLVTEVDADFNSKVRKGQLLAVVDPSAFRSKLQAAQADMTVQRATIGSNEVQVSNAQVVVDQAQRDYSRTNSLADQGLLSVNDLEKARNALEQAQNALKIAAAALNNSRAALVKVQSQLDQARIDLSHTEIRAPVDGVVIDRAVDVGQTVQSAMTVATLFRIAQDLSQVQIETKVDEADIGAIRQARAASFTVDAYPGRVFSGHIAQVRINGNAAANVVTYSVMVQAANPGELLLPGMTANVELLIAERDGVLRLPSAALRFRPGTEANGPPGAARAAGGAGPSEPALMELTPVVMRSLGLDAGQQAAVAGALRAVAARDRAGATPAADNPLAAGGAQPGYRRLVGNPRDPAAVNRQRTLNALASVLSAAQLQQYLALGRNAVAHAASVYVLPVQGVPQVRTVHVGLADDNYTELIDGVAAGERVVVRARPAHS